MMQPFLNFVFATAIVFLLAQWWLSRFDVKLLRAQLASLKSWLDRMDRKENDDDKTWPES